MVISLREGNSVISVRFLLRKAVRFFIIFLRRNSLIWLSGSYVMRWIDLLFLKGVD